MLIGHTVGTRCKLFFSICKDKKVQRRAKNKVVKAKRWSKKKIKVASQYNYKHFFVKWKTQVKEKFIWQPNQTWKQPLLRDSTAPSNLLRLNVQNLLYEMTTCRTQISHHFKEDFKFYVKLYEHFIKKFYNLQNYF